MKHLAFDLDDTLISTGATLLKLQEQNKLPIITPNEPYANLRHCLDKGLITPDDYEFLVNSAADLASPYPKMVSLLKKTILEYGEAHIVSTRTHMNTATTLNILGRILSEKELYKVKIHWCKALKLEDHGDAKMYTWQHLVDCHRVSHFVDDLAFNIKAILDNLYPRLKPIMVLQPWVRDKIYLPEIYKDNRISYIELK